MKKQLFWLAMGAMALPACTSTDVVDESIQSNAIGFQSVINKNSRAETAVNGDLTTVNFDLFSVYGYYTQDGKEASPVQVFDGEVVTKKAVSETEYQWTYTHTRFWVPSSKYYFYAYSCGDIELAEGKGMPTMDLGESDVEGRALKITNYVCDADHQHDLVTASKEGYVASTTGNSNVTFQFKHALCKVSAKFINEFPSDYTISISDVKILNFYDEGDFDVHAQKWSGLNRTYKDADDKKELPLAVAENNVAKSLNDLTSEDKADAEKVLADPVFLIPNLYTSESGSAKIQFTISVKQKNNEFLHRTITGTWNPQWQSGYAYCYNISITGDTAGLEAIVFEATQSIEDSEKWENDITDKMTFSY